ncbi:hypothetical protein BSAF29S_02014 [Bacillus safensis subsp. safensis]
MKKTVSFILASFLMMSTLTAASPAEERTVTKGKKASVKTGIETLLSSNLSWLKGKIVGLITNPTGIDANMKSSVDLLLNIQISSSLLYMDLNTAYAAMHKQEKASNPIPMEKQGFPFTLFMEKQENQLLKC